MTVPSSAPSKSKGHGAAKYRHARELAARIALRLHHEQSRHFRLKKSQQKYAYVPPMFLNAAASTRRREYTLYIIFLYYRIFKVNTIAYKD